MNTINKLKVRLILIAFFAGIILSACDKNVKNTDNILLDKGWEFRQVGTEEWREASVPGCVHNDLLTHGLIENPFIGMNEEKVQWIEKEDWEYRNVFNVSASLLGKASITLNFEGLDTYAIVSLNGQEILQGDNMFIAHKTDVKSYLQKGANELHILFKSPVKKGMEKLQKLDYILKATNEIAPEGERTNIFTRKAPYHFGWDWGPRLVTSGIWRPVEIKAWDLLKVEDVFFAPQSVSKNRANYEAKVTVHVTKEISVKAVLNIPNVLNKEITFDLNEGEQEVSIDFQIDNPKLWWSNGLGEAHLYDVNISFFQEEQELEKYTQKLGVRNLELIQEADSIGRSFYFKLNDVPVFAKGANYIPSEIFNAIQTHETYQRVINDAVKANMNMLRVWGGAVYENDEFYELCDENGILVWQDFMFACALVPGDSLHLENIRKEANYNVKRLRKFASMALWCGNNENLIAWNNWGWKEAYPKKVSDKIWRDYEKVFYEILPEAVANYHPQVSYWASSPQAYGDNMPDRKSGDEHDWTVWFAQAPFENYAKEVPRFVSEYGLQSFPEMTTIKAFTTEDKDLTYRSEVMEHRQRSNMEWIAPGMNGNEMIMRYIKKYYKPAQNFEDFVYLSQLTQAKGLKTAIEAHRRNMPYCMGSLYWQINDCWPTMSWASVDYFGRWKASHYAVKKAFEPIILSVEQTSKVLRVYVISEKLEAFQADLQLHFRKMNGDLLLAENHEIEVLPNTSTICFEMPLFQINFLDARKREMFLQVRLGSDNVLIAENIHLFRKEKDIRFPIPKITTQINIQEDQKILKLNTSHFSKGVQLSVKNEEVFFSDNYFDLIPGKDKEIILETSLDSAQISQNLMINSLADLYKSK
ncbi:MAG: glycoside hydrolase family 2 protein [Bacteroidota bacterium]